MYATCYRCGSVIDSDVVTCPRCGRPRAGHYKFAGLDPRLVEEMQKLGEDDELIMMVAEDARKKKGM